MLGKIEKVVIILVISCFVPFTAKTQTDVSLDPDFGARISAEIDKKITKGLHVNLEEEIRLVDNFSHFGRFQTTLGCSYKINQHLKVGVGYALINPYSSTNKAFKNSRHRLQADATGSISAGSWKFSLKERIQVTHYTGDFNEYQHARNLIMLKSRLMAKYSISKKYVPYSYIEFRHYLNAPVITASYDGSSYSSTTGSEEAGWFLKGFNGSYLNRFRGALGINIKFNKQNALNLYMMGDYVMDKEVDANAEGTKLKSYTRETGFVGWLGAGYTFSF